MVVTISPSLSLYKMVVLPAASRPTMRILISFLAKRRLKSLVNESPIFPKSSLHQNPNNQSSKKDAFNTFYNILLITPINQNKQYMQASKILTNIYKHKQKLFFFHTVSQTTCSTYQRIKKTSKSRDPSLYT